jgi:hypothetical protein
MVVSIFGESAEDRRDYRMGLAGLLAGVHALRILAERGPGSTDDLHTAISGIRAVLDQIPAGSFQPGERANLDGMLFKIVDAARDRELRERNG